MSIYVFSDCLSSLEPENFTTSSEKYEYHVSLELSKHETVVVFSKAACSEMTSGTLVLCPFNQRNVKEKMRSSNSDTKDIAIFWGYDLRKVLTMIALRMKYRFVTFPFVFDSHTEAIKSYGKVKHFIANTYFNIGKKLIKHFDGLILFQDKAAKLLNFKKDYFVTKPGLTTNINAHCQKRSPFIVTFAGSFTELNGVNELLKGFSNFENSDIQLRLYGYGYLKETVENYSAKYDNIHYCGVVNEQHLLEAYKESNILLNLRVLDSQCMDCAFPSKIIEILASGVPVISSDVFHDSTMKNLFYSIETITSDEISNAIKNVYDNYDFYIERANEAKEYIRNHFDYEKLGNDLYKFLDRSR